MKLILVVATILVFKTKLCFLSFIDELFQERDDEYENDDSSNDMVESSKGFRNLVTPPIIKSDGSTWTWSNPSADLFPKCKEGGCYNCITGYRKCHDGFQLFNVRLSCVAHVAIEYERRVQSMKEDFYNHQNKWKRLQTSVLQYQRRNKQLKQALFRSRQKARRCRAPKRDVSVEYEGDEYEHDENGYY